MVLPRYVKPPVLWVITREPDTVLFSNETPPVLFVILTLPLKVSPEQPEAPITTGPLEPVTETDPLTFVAHRVIPVAPAELSDPLIVPPLTHRAPPVIVMDPVTIPPDPMQVACPCVTLSDPFRVVVRQGVENPMEIVTVAKAEVESGGGNIEVVHSVGPLQIRSNGGNITLGGGANPLTTAATGAGAVLARLLEEFTHGGPTVQPDQATIDEFDREKQAGKLAHLLAQATAKG